MITTVFSKRNILHLAAIIIFSCVVILTLFSGASTVFAQTSCYVNGGVSQPGTCTYEDLSSTCRTTNNCATAPDAAKLSDLQQQCATPGSSNCTSQVQQLINASATRDAAVSNPSCTALWDLLNPICWGRLVGGVISTIAIGISGFLLGLAGLLFNWTIQYTIIDFNTFVYGGVRAGIDIAWTAFRDIANIVIIGMFTFVAISMILGMEKFGNKKFIAKILLIAVLINFSMLFSRMIIEASHVVAGQFYRAAQSQISVEGTSNTAPGAGQALLNLSQGGLAGEYIKLMGVPTALDAGTFTSTKLSKDLNNGWLALLYGLLTASFLLGATLVFLYAAFLLIVRTILLVFLMMTSALAFASFLVPAFGAEKGWSLWWQSLLKSSLLAPLLLMFFWATLVVGKSFVAGSGGSLGTLLSDPTAGSSIKALFFYLFMLGMLFASIKVASSFSSKIAGFNYAAVLPAYGFGLAGRALGFAGRQTIGRGAQYAQGKFDAAASKAPAGSSAQRMYNFGASGAGSLAKRDYNLMRGKLGEEIRSVSAVKNLDTLTGKALGGFEGIQKRYEENIATLAKKNSYTKDEREKIAKEGYDKFLRSNSSYADDHNNAEKKHKEDKENADKVRKEAQAEQDRIIERDKVKLKDLEKQLDDRRKAEAAAPGDATARTAREDAEDTLKTTRKAQTGELKEQAERIRLANNAVKRSQEQLMDVVKTTTEAAIKNDFIPKSFAKPGEIAEAMVKSDPFAIFRATNPSQKGIDAFAKGVGKAAGKEWSKDDRKETINVIKQSVKANLEKEE